MANAEFVFSTGLGYEAIVLDKLKGQPPRTDYLVFLARSFLLEPKLARGNALAGGKTWLQAALAGPHAVDKTFPGFSVQAEALSPQLALSELAWGALATSPGVHEVIAHVPYTRFDVTVSLTRARAAASGSSAAAMRAAITDELAALRAGHGPGSATVHVLIWVDGPGNVVRLQVSVPGSKLGTATTKLGGFGEKIPTSLPTAAEIVDIGSVRGSPWTLGAGPGR